MILQTILGGFAAVLVSIKMFGKRVFRVLTFWRKHDDEPAEAAPKASAASRETEKEPV
jgi:hypothetical protein